MPIPPSVQQYIGNQEWLYNVSLGLVPGVSRFRRFGFNESVGTSWVPVWTPGGAHTYPDVLVPTTFTITPTDAVDTIAGTGLQKVTCIFLDTNYAVVTEVVNTNGLTPVVTTGTGIRFIRAYGSQWGSGRTNAGTIGITATSGVAAGATQADVPADENQTLITQYTVPVGKTAVLLYARRGVGKNDDAQIKLMQRDSSATNSGFRIVNLFPIYQSIEYDQNPCPDTFPEKTDLVVMAKSTVSSTTVGAEYTLLLVDNDS